MNVHLKREACLIAGEWIAGDHWINVDDPATGRVIGRVPDLGAAETQRAIATAGTAQPAWAAMTAKERSMILRRFYELVMAQQDPLARLLTAEQGKPLSEARGEIAYAAAFIEWFAEEAKRTYGEVVPGHERGKRLIVIKQPVGVIAAITPWNFPAAMVTRKIAPALAAGCSVVLKPSELTPFSALALGALADEAGVPGGVLNIVTGDAKTIGGVLTSSDVIRKISFTGSTATGVTLFGQSAATLKRLSLELGGNAPFLVFDDADVEGAMIAKFRNSGQTCVCANRFFVQSGVHDAFVAAFGKRIADLKVGSGCDDADLGPLIDDRATAKVHAHIADATALGAVVMPSSIDHPSGGRFVSPALLTGVTSGMRVLVEETFGPLAPVVRFETEDEVLRLANATDTGLAAYVFTKDLARAWRVCEKLEVGMVGANTGSLSTELAPFGGIKMSGLGREGSRHGIDEYMELKYLCIDAG